MESITVTKSVEFDAGHRVARHLSKCSSPHGHRYRVEVTATGPIVDDPSRADYGMVVDFGDLKTLMTTELHDRFDHAMIVAHDDVELRDAVCRHGWKVEIVDFTPTAENLARYAWQRLAPLIAQRFGDDLRLELVTIYETPTSVATYRAGQP